MEREALLQKLTTLDFMATDLELYLNTHPKDSEALEKYNNVVTSAHKLRYIYEKTYGPLTSFRSYNKKEKWCWSENPWPWDKDFNFKIK